MLMPKTTNVPDRRHKIVVKDTTDTTDRTAPKSNGGPLSCKESEKHAVSVYGLQRMPVTLYAEQWERLLGFAEEIRGFIKGHPGLARKQRS